ncbi:hypothetical protein HYPSUDRAFT_967396 [Hypholoma sublateritium FD-334 SS-4]|uniref:Uncharacterized protein n=1 Tax=Hypholoma sublateritium (strain FD-334 SS-4) TaxID=945553 RepID=A0A0D2NH04_HYPSF|nr:hypothetical protein HYPSUDRAFT_967396 [Hypholoma sublateritium FD-334 SS-4]
MVPRSLTAVFQGGYLLVQRENIMRSANDTGPHTTLQAAPFNRLGVWAYIAFGFIVLAVSTVLSYMIYTCCYSARQRQYYGNNTRAARRIGAVKIHSIDRHNAIISRNQDYQLDKPCPRALTRFSRVDIAQGNTKLNSCHRNLGLSENPPDVLDLKPPQSKKSFSLNAHDHFSEGEGQWLSSPPLAHTSDKAAPYIPFHLPPPPSSPTPAHKEIVERQRKRGSMGYLSPGSPSPSYLSNESPPSITNQSILGVSRRRSRSMSRGLADIDPESTNMLPKPAGEFDSNNIRFVSPRNPFGITPSNDLWNDPKLSPIGGAVISTSTPVSIVPGIYPFAQSLSPKRAEQLSVPVTPVLEAIRQTGYLPPYPSARADSDCFPEYGEVHVRSDISSRSGTTEGGNRF